MAWPAPVSIATPAPRAGSGRFQTVGSLWAVRIPSSLFAVPLGASCAVTNRDIVGLADASRADGAQTSAAVRRSAKTPGPPLPCRVGGYVRHSAVRSNFRPTAGTETWVRRRCLVVTPVISSVVRCRQVQAVGSPRYRPQAVSRASSGAPAVKPLGRTESWYPSLLAR